MALRSLTFDDDDERELHVFSGPDLPSTHHDLHDLDWQEIAERSMIDERRSLVIAQVAALEELIDEFILYLKDPADIEELRHRLGGMMVGARLSLTRWTATVVPPGTVDGASGSASSSSPYGTRSAGTAWAPSSGPTPHAGASRSTASAADRHVLTARSPRDRHGEAGAAVGRPRDRDLSAVEAHVLAHQGQPQPRPGGVGLTPAGEAPEDVLALVLGHPKTRGRSARCWDNAVPRVPRCVIRRQGGLPPPALRQYAVSCQQKGEGPNELDG